MRRYRPISTLTGSLAAALPLAAVATTTTAHVAQATTSDTDAAAGSMESQGTATFCSPIFGTGKNVGVPITLEYSDGGTITDISGYTFQLTDGTDTQDVTEYITSPAQQPLAAGDPGEILYGPIDSLAWMAPSLYRAPADQPTGNASFAFTNPGYFFLACTPDTTTPTEVFSEGMKLQALRNGKVAAEGSVIDRSATYLGYNDAGISERLRPSDTPFTNDNIDELYKALLDTYGIPFNRDFAQLAVLQLSNATNDGVRCWVDLLSEVDSQWSWGVKGTSFINELTGGTATTTSFPLLDDRTHGVGTESQACNIASEPGQEPGSTSTQEAEFFLDVYAAQLLLIDGPAGRVTLPAQVQDLVAPAAYSLDNVYAPAVRLVTDEPRPTTTTTARELPDTGSDTTGTLLPGLAALAGGAALVVVARRRRV